MSFLKGIMGAGGAGVAGGNPMAAGLGRLLGTEGSHVSDVAGRIGTGMNQIAAAGGAQPGYQAPAVGGPQPGPMPADPNNHLQLLDPSVLQALVQRFRPSARGQNEMEQY